MKDSFIFYFSIAVLLGISIATVDSHPNWDYRPVSYVELALVTAVCGYIAGRKPWILALAAGIWMPMFSILITQNYDSLIAFVAAFAGVYAGFGLRLAFRRRS
jgi:hypothetical protein